MEPTIKVTRIKNRWHARLLMGANVGDEMACDQRADIGFICRELLRWYDKCGGASKFAHAARERHNRPPHGIVGRIWWPSYFLGRRRSAKALAK